MVKRFSTQKESILVADVTGTQQNDGYVCRMHAWSRSGATAIYCLLEYIITSAGTPVKGTRFPGTGFLYMIGRVLSGKVDDVVLCEGSA